MCNRRTAQPGSAVEPGHRKTAPPSVQRDHLFVALVVGGPAGYGRVFYASLWAASLYTATAALLILTWRWAWRSADMVRGAEEF